MEDFTTDFPSKSKDCADPSFIPTETESMFILTAHLNGYKKEMIKIDINEDKTAITISGEKPVEEMGMVGWRVYKKIVIEEFRKVIQIPDGVAPNLIDWSFNEEDGILLIFMPKSTTPIIFHQIPDIDYYHFSNAPQPLSSEEPEKIENTERIEPEQKRKHEVCGVEPGDTKIGEDSEEHRGENGVIEGEKHHEKEDRNEKEAKECQEMETQNNMDEGSNQMKKNKQPSPRYPICAPCAIAGSAFLVSLIVLVVHLVRNNKKEKKK